MAISRAEKGMIYVECDHNNGRCAEVVDVRSQEFSDALEMMKEEGWVNLNMGPMGWIQLCPAHKEDLREFL